MVFEGLATLTDVGAGIVIPSGYTAPVDFVPDAGVTVVSEIPPPAGVAGTRADTLYLDLDLAQCPALTEIPLGAVAFFLSDLAVARDRFVAKGWVNRVWGLPLYYFGQVLLATSVA